MHKATVLNPQRRKNLRVAKPSRSVTVIEEGMSLQAMVMRGKGLERTVIDATVTATVTVTVNVTAIAIETGSEIAIETVSDATIGTGTGNGTATGIEIVIAIVIGVIGTSTSGHTHPRFLIVLKYLAYVD